MRKSARQREKNGPRAEQLIQLQRARRAQARGALREEDNEEVEWDPDEDDDDESSMSDEDESPTRSRAKSLPLRGTRKRPLDPVQDDTDDGMTTRASRKRDGDVLTINPKDPRRRRLPPSKEAPPPPPPPERNPKDPRQRRIIPPRSSPEQKTEVDPASSGDVKLALPIYTDTSDEDEELNLVQVQKTVPKAPVVKSILKRPMPKPTPQEPKEPQPTPVVGNGWAGMLAKAQNKPATLHKRPNRQRQLHGMRPAMTSSNALSHFYEDIMDWDFGLALTNEYQNKADSSSEARLQVPSKFESYEHYFEVWKPLAVQEVQAQSISCITTEMPGAVPIVATANMLTLGVSTMKVSLSIDRKANPSKKQISLLDDFRKDDLILLSADSGFLARRTKKNPENLDASFGILAIVDTQKSSREGLVAVVTSKKWREFKTDAPLFAFKISNLVTSFREFRALCQCREYKLMPLLLSGEAQSASTRLDSLGMAYVQWLRNTFNESQLEAITAAATSHGFTLIKGPPGTGKTTTLKGLLNSLHLREYNRYYNAVLDVARRPDHETSKAWAAIGDEKPHILVAAPSNIAVDNIVAKIMEEGFCDGEGRQYFPHIIRVGRGANINVKSVVLEGMVEAICSQPLDAIEMRCRQLQHELAIVQNDALLLRNEFRAIIKWIHDLVDDAKKNPAPVIEIEKVVEDAPPPILDHGTSLDFEAPAEETAGLITYRSDSEDESANVPFSCDDDVSPASKPYHILDDEVDEPLPTLEEEEDEPFQPDEPEVDEPLPIKVANDEPDEPAPPLTDEPPLPLSLEEGECSDSEPPPPPPPSSPPLPPDASANPPEAPPVEPPPPPPPQPYEDNVIDYNAYKPYKDMAQRINLCLERFHTLKLELQRYALVKRSLEAHGRVVKETQDSLESSFLESAHIVFTTLSSAGHRALDDSTRYDILVVDEAAQAVELSTIIPMRFGSRQCVLVGDPQQLSATTFSRESAQSLYERSLFERLESCGHPVHMLRTQYRSHPTISAFPRQYFYGGLLQDGDNVRQPTYSKLYHSLGPAFKPLVFWNLVNSREGMSAMSRSNPMETKLAVNLYLTLRNSCPPDAIRGKVGVITPYAAQMDELKRAFAEACQGDFNQDVEINTVDGYQGREKDIIILSTVRSDPRKGVGFLNDIRRMNVALTRAKFACYVIGSEAALQNSKPWAALLDHARMTGCMVNVQNPQENLFALAPIPPGPPRGYIVHRSPRNRSPRGRSPPYRRGGGGGRGRGGRHPNNRHRMPQV
ncbi:hypothetical protein Ae201684P_003869 [Aphanomyces euteiches]|uniref:Helicase ATP-binding domain-containing protein n=1 Tax=Aphanomyces euteiches TaxID=100861 RepID=A0A6G0XTH2_9STRA|nr:hypothetical protein Ae201684_001466 [Aphanomyces euteiches]KAH9075185.1 hypothetical protein Ae201684P_003869 [Aphanomyces euteiches]